MQTNITPKEEKEVKNTVHLGSIKESDVENKKKDKCC